MTSPAATPPAGTADLREAIARAICVARDTNPDCQHEGPARDGKIDGRWDRTPTANCSSGRVPWHYGWRNHAHVADAILAGPLATLAAENEALRVERAKHMRWLGLSDDMHPHMRETIEGHLEYQAQCSDVFRARARAALTQGGSDAA